MVCGPFHLDDLFDVAHALPTARVDGLAEWATVAVGIEDPDYTGDPRLHRPAAEVAAGAHGPHGVSVVRAIAGDYLAPARIGPSDLHRALVGLGAAEAVERLSQAGHFGELLAQTPRVARWRSSGPAKHSSSTCRLMASITFGC